ncbi:MAG: YeaH/YhbH family protein [Burkholderiaceae bacterium]|nr:YeaH/YhbH family protein [Burkholderiaceae bacterium]MCD6672632.1 YeaH/YhbH family protein [Burkholderiaceae bacterium]
MSVVIDRRPNDRSGSAVNRERFMRRYKAQIRRAVTDMVAGRSIRDLERGGKVSIPVRDVSEPSFRHGAGGDYEHVLPGNRRFQPGDKLPRPEGGDGEGDGSGSEGGSGEATDAFAFTLSREEFMQIFFDDLELPRMIRTTFGEIREQCLTRAGYTTNGSPTNLSVNRSLRNAIGRRIALRGAPRRALAHVQALLESAPSDAPERPTWLAEVERLQRRIAAVPFLDELDLRYRYRTLTPKPVSQAVMFCLMDVSASMDERKKDLAKRFFALLHLFLSRKYERLEIVFIRHTDDAEEVDEQRFFHDRKTGGTVVLSALSLMNEIIQERFPLDAWNIYGAQASDGDAFGADPEKSRGFLETALLPLVRHYAYIEVCEAGSRVSTLSAAYRRIPNDTFAMREVHESRDIWPVFRGLFGKQQSSSIAAMEG